MKATIDEKGVRKYLEGVSGTIAHFNATVGDLPAIADGEDYKAACDVLFEAAGMKKTIAEEKDKVVGAAKLIIATVSGWFRPVEDDLAAHEEKVKGLVREYVLACEDAQRSMLKQAAKIAKVDPKKARELNAQAGEVLPPKVKGVAFVGKIKVEVVDEKKLPEEFFRKVVDEAKVRAAVEAGETPPGVLVTDERTVRVTPSQREV